MGVPCYPAARRRGGVRRDLKFEISDFRQVAGSFQALNVCESESGWITRHLDRPRRGLAGRPARSRARRRSFETAVRSIPITRPMRFILHPRWRRHQATRCRSLSIVSIMFDFISPHYIGKKVTFLSLNSAETDGYRLGTRAQKLTAENFIEMIFLDGIQRAGDSEEGRAERYFNSEMYLARDIPWTRPTKGRLNGIRTMRCIDDGVLNCARCDD